MSYYQLLETVSNDLTDCLPPFTMYHLSMNIDERLFKGFLITLSSL
jgi:hypothetical protein